MQQGAANQDAGIGFAQKARIAICFALLPNLFGDQLYFGFKDRINMFHAMIRVCGKKWRAIRENGGDAVGKVTNVGLKLAATQQSFQVSWKFDFGHNSNNNYLQDN